MIYNKLNLSITDFCSKDSVGRIDLQNVLFKKDKTVATDSHTLIEVETPEIDRKEFPVIPNTEIKEFTQDLLIPEKSVKKMLANIPKNNVLPILENVIFVKSEKNEGKEHIEDNITAEFATTDLTTADKVITTTFDGEYPDYKQIMPTEEPTKKVIVNIKYLQKILNFWSKNGKDRITLEMFGNDKEIETPIVAKDKFKSQNVTALVMPIKNID